MTRHGMYAKILEPNSQPGAAAQSMSARFKEDKIMAIKTIEFMCSHCGTKAVRHEGQGKPNPSKCPKRKNGKPHVWTVNRKF